MSNLFVFFLLFGLLTIALLALLLFDRLSRGHYTGGEVKGKTKKRQVLRVEFLKGETVKRGIPKNFEETSTGNYMTRTRNKIVEKNVKDAYVQPVRPTVRQLFGKEEITVKIKIPVRVGSETNVEEEKKVKKRSKKNKKNNKGKKKA